MTVQDGTSGVDEGEAFFARLDELALRPRRPAPPPAYQAWEVVFAHTGAAPGESVFGDGCADVTEADARGDAGVADGAGADDRDRDTVETDAVASPSAEPEPEPPSSVVVSGPLRVLIAAVTGLVGQDPTGLPGPQALLEARVLLGEVERLRTVALGRIGDVETRKLHLLDGATSAGVWVARQQTSLDRREVALARRLSRFPLLSQALRDGGLAMSVAARLAAALVKLGRYLDRPDGLIDGQDGEMVLTATLTDGIAMLVCESAGGLPDDSGRLTGLREALAEIAGRPVGQLARFEAGLLVLAGELEVQLLPSAIGRLLDQLLPNELERRAADAHDERGFGMRRNSDGSGWTITRGDLDLECGELLWTVLHAAMTADPDNPVDTAGWAAARDQGWQPTDGHPETIWIPRDRQTGPADTDAQNQALDATDATATAVEVDVDADAGDEEPVREATEGPTEGPAGTPTGKAADERLEETLDQALVDEGRPGPRSRAQRQHDALRNALRLLLDSAALGTRDKATPHLAVTTTLTNLAGHPGSAPATSAAGTTVPRSLVQSWSCNASITRFVLSLGRKVIAASHTGRTLTRLERRAKHLETGHRCQGAGCPSPPGTPLVPHHPHAYALSGTTSLSDTALLCHGEHTRLHRGEIIRLRDGRLLGPNGWIEDHDSAA